ncbi:hypothetical protein IAW_05010 [Bacillus cereus str. Schrouff]|uniref:hypothetical protein n=1 Tax=Bacillus cereus TaxID=1396 RepID=UPI00032FCFE5|nr:hypothetical protein [Bacillus cereus]EOO05701.1 hypothetical protein IAW_05010 [Bacillus cereus str. Schrouff]EOO81843.1 hypothetical protein IGY_05554 [Bacillus cereus K-5975c]MCU4896391.1 hypothetical protein [Bacillus cereus]
MADFDEFNQVWQKQIENMKKQFSEINIKQSLDIMEEVAVYGAEQGWTIPLHTTMRDCQELIHVKSKSEMDKVFEEHYLIEENYMKMKKRLTSNAFEGRWEVLLEECFQNYEEGRFRITIPSLFSILEGTLFNIVQDQDWKQAFREKENELMEGSIRNQVYYSVITFINHAFSFGKFKELNYKPALINRNWVLHGRYNVNEWERVDSLRLFNALYSITLLNFNSQKK